MYPFNLLLKSLLLVCLTSNSLFADTTTASPQALQLIKNLQLQESHTASRDHPRWHPPKQITVVIPAQFKPIAKPLIASLQQVAPDLIINTYFPAPDAAPDEKALEFLKTAEVIFGRCTKNLLDQTPNVLWIQLYSSGAEACTAAARISHPDLILSNIQHIAAPAIAEHAIALTLMLTRNLDAYYRQQLEGNWQRILTASDNEIGGKTLLVLGLGGIGTEVAKRAHSLGMHVIATRNSSRSGPDYVEQVGLASDMYELAKQADIVVNALPSTDKTKNIINEKFFSAMKKGSRYISVGRGTTTNLDDLVKALHSGQLAGAGLDVTNPEPLPKDHPLWTMDNVIITPHIAGFSMAAIQRSFILYQENLRRYIQGDKLLNIVDIERGY